MVIAPSTIYGGDELSHFLESQRVTHGFVTTAALGTVSPEGLSDFGDVVVGGEACPPDLVQRWAPGRRLCNAYGPTETTVMSNIGEPMVSSEYITVGGPLRGFDEIVLDQRLHPVPRRCCGRAVHLGRRARTWISPEVCVDRRTIRGRPVRSPGPADVSNGGLGAAAPWP